MHSNRDENNKCLNTIYVRQCMEHIVINKFAFHDLPVTICIINQKLIFFNAISSYIRNLKKKKSF